MSAANRQHWPTFPTQQIPSRQQLNELATALAQDLAASGYTREAVAAFLGEAATADLQRGIVAPARRKCQEAITAQQSPVWLGVLSCFGVGDATERRWLDRAFPTLRTTGLHAHGLVQENPPGSDCWSATVSVEVTEMGLIFADFSPSVTGRAVRGEHVLGVGGATRSLLGWTPRTPVATALDLGTGSGAQALALTTHAERIIATDISARALTYARLTMACSHANPVPQLREGSMYEAVRGESFDLIVSNPPFVITPEALREEGALTYRDGGAPADAICRALIVDAKPHLRSGGHLYALGNWLVRDEETWQEPIRRWVDESGLAAWIVLRQLQTPAEYAHTWLVDAGMHPGETAFEAGMEAYLDYFAQQRTHAIAFGYMSLRHPRTERECIRRYDDGRETVTPTAAAATQFWDAVDQLTAAGCGPDDDTTHALGQFLKQRLIVAADVIEERYYQPGAQDPTLIRLAQREGLARSTQVDSCAAACVGVAHGELTVGQSLTAIAQLMELPLTEVVATAVPQLRELVLQGFLHLG